MPLYIKDYLIQIKPLRKDKIGIPDRIFVSEHNLLSEEKSNDSIAYFRNGILYDVYPRKENTSIYDVRDVALNARYFVSDNHKYDLFNVDDLINFIIPELDNNDSGSPVLLLDYILSMRSKTLVSQDLAVPFIVLTVNIMIKRGLYWSKSSYDRLIMQLHGLDLDEDARYLEIELRKRLPFMEDPCYLRKVVFNKTIELCSSLETDFIEVPFQGISCSECAKYQGRIYSLSGNSSIFPKLPNQVRIYGGFHEGCRHMFHAKIISEKMHLNRYIQHKDGNTQLVTVDAIESSNRPYIDDRSADEVERFNLYKMKHLKEQQLEPGIEQWKKWIQRSIEYAWVKEYLPKIAPKSQSGYSNMKNRRSKNYLRIEEEAKKLGKELDH